MEQELTKLFAEKGVPSEFEKDGDISSLNGVSRDGAPFNGIKNCG
jgi:hypothetical protein